MNKQDFRKKAIKNLEGVKNRYYLNKKLNRKLETTIALLNKNTNIKKILFYMPFWFEANILPTLYKCRVGHNCFIPFIENVSFKMVPFRQPFFKNSLGIKEGSNSVFYKKKLDLIIVPIVGYDINNRRVGFGKGMYDRFFSTLKKKPIVIFVQMQEVFCEKIITNKLDIKFDIYINPKKIIFRKNLYKDLRKNQKCL